MTDSPRTVAIIGSGPTGYTAAIYLSRARLEPTIFSGREIGGQLMYTTDVENFPGFPEGVAGPNLMFAMRQQAEKFGTKIIDDLVSKVQPLEKGFRVWYGEQFLDVAAVLIATGARSRMLGLPQEGTLLGKGLSTCAVCDAAFYRDQKVVVVGGGDSAMEDALSLAKFTNRVVMIHRKDSFRASQIMQERVLGSSNITVRWNTTLSALHVAENGRISGVTFQDTVTKAELHDEEVGGVFYAIGHVPSTDFLGDLVQTTKDGYVVTHLGLDAASVGFAQAELAENQFVPYLTATSRPGVFAAGDCVDFRYRQAITAAAFGTLAALDIERWFEHTEA